MFAPISAPRSKLGIKNLVPLNTRWETKGLSPYGRLIFLENYKNKHKHHIQKAGFYHSVTCDWNSSVCVCVSYLDDLFGQSGLQPLEMFPVGNQELKHVTRNLGHCLVPKLCTQRGEWRGQNGHSTTHS